MFYRPGGSTKSINRQYDQCYADFVGAATGWLPTHKGDTIGVNICRASIVFGNAASSLVTNTPIAPEATVLMELKMFGVDLNSAAFPADQWQNMVVATSRRAHRAGWVRLRILAINSGDGTGVNLALQISRTGDVGAQT